MNTKSGYRVRRKKKFKYFIITDDKNKPMAWDEMGEQLAYCTDTSWEDIHHPIMVYTHAKANRLIDKSNKQKQKYKSALIAYKLMPIEPVFNPVKPKKSATEALKAK